MHAYHTSETMHTISASCNHDDHNAVDANIQLQGRSCIPIAMHIREYRQQDVNLHMLHVLLLTVQVDDETCMFKLSVWQTGPHQHPSNCLHTHL